MITEVPDATLRFVATVIAALPPLVMTDGENLAFANLGSPLAINVTVPENPVPGVTVTVYVVLPPLEIVAVDGDTVKEKSPLVTVIVRFAGGLDKPALSVTVRDAVYVPGVE